MNTTEQYQVAGYLLYIIDVFRVRIIHSMMEKIYRVSEKSSWHPFLSHRWFWVGIKAQRKQPTRYQKATTNWYTFYNIIGVSVE